MWITNKLKREKLCKEWRNRNPHNETGIINDFPFDRVSVGKKTYGDLYVLAFNKENHLEIGNYVSIAPGTIFILSADHYLNHLSTYPFRTKIINGELEGVSKGDIIVEDDAWIGQGVTILSGVRIGQGAAIAAGSVVSKDVPSYAVAAGVPARVIRYRFEKEIIRYLKGLDYSGLDDEMIKGHEQDLYTDLEKKSLAEIQELFAWFPRKQA